MRWHRNRVLLLARDKSGGYPVPLQNGMRAGYLQGEQQLTRLATALVKLAKGFHW
jgi:hypothetical protein